MPAAGHSRKAGVCMHVHVCAVYIRVSMFSVTTGLAVRLYTG